MTRTFAALLITLLSLATVSANFLRAAEKQKPVVDSFELTPLTDAADIVPPALRENANFKVSDDVSINDYFYHFHLTSNAFGEFDVDSLDLLQVRAYEINVLAGVPEIKGSAELGRAMKSDIKDTAKNAARTVITPVKSAKAVAAELEDDGRAVYDFIRLRKRNQPKDSLLFGEEKRSQAHSLGLDVYSTNPAVQDYLTQLAKARTPGTKLVDVSISVTTFVIPFGTPISLAISAGKYREKLSDKFDTLSPMELYRYNDKILKKMNVQSEQREQFLEYGSLTPRQKTEIVADLKTLEQLQDCVPFLDACREPHPSEGIWQLQSTDLFAKYNKTVEPIQSISGVGLATVGMTVSGKQVLFIPADIVYWTEAIAKLVDNRDPSAAAAPTAQREFVSTGHITDRAKKEIEARGFMVRDHFLNEVKLADTVELKPQP